MSLLSSISLCSREHCLALLALDNYDTKGCQYSESPLRLNCEETKLRKTLETQLPSSRGHSFELLTIKFHDRFSFSRNKPNFQTILLFEKYIRH